MGVLTLPLLCFENRYDECEPCNGKMYCTSVQCNDKLSMESIYLHFLLTAADRNERRGSVQLNHDSALVSSIEPEAVMLRGRGSTQVVSVK